MILHSDWEGNDCIRKLRCHCIQILHSDIYSAPKTKNEYLIYWNSHANSTQVWPHCILLGSFGCSHFFLPVYIHLQLLWVLWRVAWLLLCSINFGCTKIQITFPKRNQGNFKRIGNGGMQRWEKWLSSDFQDIFTILKTVLIFLKIVFFSLQYIMKTKSFLITSILEPLIFKNILSHLQ